MSVESKIASFESILNVLANIQMLHHHWIMSFSALNTADERISSPGEGDLACEESKELLHSNSI